MRQKYRPSKLSRRVTSAILETYNNADFMEKQRLNKMSKSFIEKIHNMRHEMSQEMVLELVGKIGIAEVERKIDLRKLTCNHGKK